VFSKTAKTLARFSPRWHKQDSIIYIYYRNRPVHIPFRLVPPLPIFLLLKSRLEDHPPHLFNGISPLLLAKSPWLVKRFENRPISIQWLWKSNYITRSLTAHDWGSLRTYKNIVPLLSGICGISNFISPQNVGCFFLVDHRKNVHDCWLNLLDLLKVSLQICMHIYTYTYTHMYIYYIYDMIYPYRFPKCYYGRVFPNRKVDSHLKHLKQTLMEPYHDFTYIYPSMTINV